ncbi:MAG: DUF5693 family protein [Bacillota bacterium]
MKKVLTLIVIISLIGAGISLAERIGKIDKADNIEVIFDGDGFSELAAQEPELEIEKLKEYGVSGISVYQQSIKDLKESGEMVRIETPQLMLLNEDKLKFLESAGIAAEDLDRGAVFAASSKNLRQSLHQLAEHLEEQYNAELIDGDDLSFLFFPQWHDKLLNLNLSYNGYLYETAENSNLKIALRSANDLNSLDALENNLKHLSPEMIIFDGEEITGYPDSLDRTAELLKSNSITFGYIEAFIAAQDGAKNIASSVNYNLLRVHSMQQDEVEQTSISVMVDRYLRAVRERNVRIIYFKPYLKGNNLLDKNYKLLSTLKAELNNAGYEIGNAESAPFFSASLLSFLAIFVGTAAGGIILFNYLLEDTVEDKFRKWLNYAAAAAAASVLILLFLNKEVFLRQLTALAAAVIFPSLAVIAFLLHSSDGHENEKNISIFMLIFKYTAAVLTALTGGIFVSAVLNSTPFILKILQFRGVKFSFLLPLMIISLYYFLKLGNEDLKKRINSLLEAEIRVKHLIVAGILALTAVIYIGRTGNFPLLPVPAWEKTLRSLLEKILYVRPRFKEFLIGHPIFVLSLWLSAKNRKKLYFYPVLMLASVGMITAANTFSHLHTPVIISLIRTFHSYWLGLFLGIILIITYQFIVFLFKKYFQAEQG